MNKAVIFDLDGTLLDTVPDICDGLNVMMKHYGYPTLSQKEVMAAVGHGARNLVKTCIKTPLTEEELDERLAFYNQAYIQTGSVKTKLFDGMPQVLKELKSRGYKLAIMTNKPQINTDEVYDLYLKEYNFDRVVGQSGSVRCKPDKTATLNLLKDFNVLPKGCYFIGDGDTDVITSINAGTNGIAVLWGYRSKEFLTGFGAKVFADTPLDLLNIIK